MSKLVNGRIPTGTDCPFRARCNIAESGNCRHLGKDHKVDFSCGTARLFDITDRPPRQSTEKE
jgi:hypothetical protein